MKIWIDGFEANVPQRLGSGQVAFELIKNFEKLDFQNNYTILLTRQPISDLPKEREGFKYKLIRPSRMITLVGIPLAIILSKEKPDLIFSPTHYIPRFTSVPRIVTIFDLSFFYFKKMFKVSDYIQLKNWTGYSVKNAKYIVTISKSTKKDIVKFYDIDPKKIIVAYPGYDATIFKPFKDKEKIASFLEKYGIDQPYILYTGTIQPRKNLVKLIESFTNIEGLKLVIAGKYSGTGRQAWMTEEILSAPKKFGVEEKIIFTNYIPADELALLMNGATAYILVSLYEGFGLPALEAMACGAPVIASNVSSLPEVVGDAGLLVDPNSATQIEQAIRTIYTDKKLRNKLSKKSLERAKKFSWKKMTKEILEVFEKVK